MAKPLSFSQAQACENATLPRCRCQCGAELPMSDPHYASDVPELPFEPQADPAERADTAERKVL